MVIVVADQWRATLGSAGLLAALDEVRRFALAAPRDGELREIVEIPALRAGLVFEQGRDEQGREKALDQVILDDLERMSLHVEAPLPLLQVALAQLEERKEGNLLTFAAYREMGGVVSAIRTHAKAALAEWQTAEQQPVLDRLLFRLVQRDPQQRIVCRLAPRKEIEADAEMRALEEHLVAPQWRLLQGHNDQDTEGAIRIAHDVLLDHVEAFARFREDERDNVILLADARDAAARWAATERRPAALLNHHSPSVERLEALLTRLGMQADDQLGEFIAASREEIERLQRERDAALLSRSRFLAEFARQRNEVSDFGTALALGLEAIPDPDRAIAIAVASQAVLELDRATRSLRERCVLRGHDRELTNAAFDPSGRRVLTASYDGTTRLWHAATGAEIAVLRGQGGILSAVFDPCGARVLTASDDNAARLWDAATGAELVVLRGHRLIVESAVFDPSGARVLTVSWDRSARIWDAATGVELAVLRGHADTVWNAAFDPSGARVATASADKTARLWDAATGAELVVFRGHDVGIRSAVFDPSGVRALTASDDNTTRLWDAASNAELVVLRGHGDAVFSAVFDRSGTRVLTASADGTARLWQAATGAEIAVLRGHNKTVWKALFDPSGSHVVTASEDGTVRLWNSATGLELAVLRGHDGQVVSAVYDPTGLRVLTASHDKTARLWDSTFGTKDLLLGDLVHDASPSGSATFDPSGTRVLTASQDGTARLWDAAAGSELTSIQVHEVDAWDEDDDDTGDVRIAIFDPSGRRLLTVESEIAQLWDATGGTELARLVGHWEAILTAEFDSSGACVLTASSDNTARLWDAATGAELVVLRHPSAVLSAAFDPSGTRVLTVSNDSTARLWHAATGTELTVLRGHDGWVERAVFDPTGTRVLTASHDNRARLWDATTGAELVVLRGHESWVLSAVFHPSGARVLTVSTDGTARIWRVFPTVAELVEYARLIKPRALTPAQRKEFFLD